MSRATVTFLAAAIFAGASAAAASVPALQVAGRAPLTVTGKHFAPRERITVTVYSATITARVGAAGRFQVVFARIRLGPCQSPQVRVVGARGEKATLEVPPAGCMAALGG
jgi:hypothetical protein